MDALFFRALTRGLEPLLLGRRLEKVYGPAPEAWTLVVHGRGDTMCLLFRPARSGGLLCLSPSGPENPASPTAQVMWWRKRLSGRRILALRVDWPRLRLALELTPGEGRFLLLDVRQGLSLLPELPEDFGQPPLWPGLAEVLAEAHVYRRAPQVSPALRRHLSGLTPQAAENLWRQVQRDQDGPVYLPAQPSAGMAPTVWPQPLAMAQDDPVAAARTAFEPEFFALVAASREAAGQTLARRQERKTTRVLQRLDQDRRRLEAMVALQPQAEALQQHLWRLADQPLPEVLELEHAVHGGLRIALNPHLSAAENMARLFAQVAKGRRGLEAVARRLAQVRAGGAFSSARPASATPSLDKPAIPQRFRGLAVRLYRSSEGLLMARGKNAAANHALLTKAANPHDLWFHAKDVAGAHVIVRRDHPRQTVGPATRREAAILAALASSRKDEAKAEVVCALVRRVRTIKGAPLGLVRVEEAEETLLVALDPSLEESLAWGGVGQPGQAMDATDKME